MDEDIVTNVIKDVCRKCMFYKKDFGICGGEILPIDKAIIRNIEGRGLCQEVKDYVKEQKNGKN